MMRILHLPTTVGGGPTGLAQQQRLLGHHAEVWSLDQNYLAYTVDRVIMDPRKPLLGQLFSVIGAGAYVFGRWDVVHYNYGSTLYSNGGKLLGGTGGGLLRSVAARLLGGIAAVLQRLELAILAARRIPVFVLYQGDDARQGDYSLAHFAISIATQVPTEYYTPQSDAWKRRQIALMSRHAAGVHAVNPDLLHVLPPATRFIPYGHVPFAEWEPRYTQADRPRLVFAHAPSNRRVKGTDLILGALDELRLEGYEFEIDLIEGLSNSEALARYAESDIVIDQLYAGWYGGVAVEAMALGKPVVVYLRDDDFEYLPEQMAADLPFFRATPASIKDALRAILETPRPQLVERAKQSRAYVERWHDPVAIASTIDADYRRALENRKRRRSAR